MRSTSLIAFTTVACLAPPLVAAPPVVSDITPRGAERGKPVEITVAGTNLTPAARLILPFKSAQTPVPDAKPNPAQVRFRLTVDASVPFGVYPVRIATDDGVSPLVLFEVDPFPGVVELEDNSTFDKAQKVPVPVIITGQCAGGDVDFYRFSARGGQRVVVETETARVGSAVVPQIRVTDAGRRFVAADDTQALAGDCRVAFTAAADGDYVVEFSDSRYRGGVPPHYRLRIADFDWADEVFPLGGRRGEAVEFTLVGGSLANPVRVRRTLDDALGPGLVHLGLEGVLRPGAREPRLAVGDLPERVWVKSSSKDPKALDVLPPVTINSRLERADDADRFQFAVQAGQRYRIAVQAAALGSRLDGVLRVSDQGGKPVALVDDVDVPAQASGLAATKEIDPSADVTVPAGVNLLVVEVRDQRRRGGVGYTYRLTIEPALPEFAVHQPAAEVNVPRGGAVALTVPVARRGYTGPIRLTVPDLPSGLSLQGGHIPAGANEGLFTLTAAADISLTGPQFLGIDGRATVDAREVHRRAEQQVVLSRDGGVPLSAVPVKQFALALTAAEPLTVRGPAAIEVVKGYPAALPVTVTRAKDQQALAVTVTGSVPLPIPAPGQRAVPVPLTFQPAVAAAGSGSASVTVTAAASASEGQPFDLVVEGKAKVGAGEKTVSGPAVAVTVVGPFAVEVLTSSLTLKAGQSATITGRVRRHARFKEPVQLKLAGLPAGIALAAQPEPVAGERADFQFELKADPKAAAGNVTLTLTGSTTITGAAYAAPSVTVPLQVVAAK
jgi:hypothetical protein